MKKIFTIFLIIIIFLFMCFFIYKTNNSINLKFNQHNSSIQLNVDKTTVTYNGWLHTNGSFLENEKNEIIQLHGLSSHGIEWFSDVITYENLKNLKDNWNINVFRIAMYTDSHGRGYIYNPVENKEKVYSIIDMAIQLDMYVIVDWHILDDNNPQIHKEDAKLFFDEISSRYSDIPNVIYEICNEPNGDEVTWNKDIKLYAEELIPIIRNNSENSLIIVGTPDWCKKIKEVADDPLDFNNIVYSCHFYSGTHGSQLREKIDYCIDKNIPIFVSECGLTDASGNGITYLSEFSEWINYLNSKNISWIYWSFSNKDESSSILLPEYTPNIANNSNVLENSNNYSNNTIDENISNTNNSDSLDINSYLTDSGKFIKTIFNEFAK